MLIRVVVFSVSLFFLSSCDSNSRNVDHSSEVSGSKISLSDRGFWTLYRNSSIDKTMRIHVASFDSIEGGSDEGNYEYNKQNCEAVSKSLGSQVGVVANYWCERGLIKIEG